MKDLLITFALCFSIVTSFIALTYIVDQERRELFKFSPEQQKQFCNNVNSNGARND